MSRLGAVVPGPIQPIRVVEVSSDILTLGYVLAGLLCLGLAMLAALVVVSVKK